jgi:hypothetical protein
MPSGNGHHCAQVGAFATLQRTWRWRRRFPGWDRCSLMVSERVEQSIEDFDIHGLVIPNGNILI